MAAQSWLAKLEDKGLEVDVVSYTSVVVAWAKAGKPDAGWVWEKPDAAECCLVKLEFKDLGADVVSYTSVFAF